MIRVLGGGYYGCHIALQLLKNGFEVEVHEKQNRLFSGASGNNPGRLHLGFHYPRSKLTRAACQLHNEQFMREYGNFTRGIPVNIYAVAKNESMVDYANYCQSLHSEVESVEIPLPEEFGLQNVEGAMLTGERHILISEARRFFSDKLEKITWYEATKTDASDYDWTIDCTFCANGKVGIDRYEPCVTTLIEGPWDKAVTIMDGPFPSIYPWDESLGLCSLTSAKFTPLARCSSREEAESILKTATKEQVDSRAEAMLDQISHYWPAARDMFKVVDNLLSIRAMPRSGADSRLVDVLVDKESATMTVRAGKIDAIFAAADIVLENLK